VVVAEFRISAEARTEFGKGGARRVRRAGKLPAVLYGHGTDPRHISLVSREFEQALRADGANVLLDLQIDGSSELALPKSVQRDPVRGVIEHVDLILVRRGEQITVDVPVTIEGDVAADGLLDQQLTTLSVTADATRLPTGFTLSIVDLPVGGSIHAGDVELPEGTELAGDPEQVVVHILAAPTAAQLEADLSGAEADLGAGPSGGGERVADSADTATTGEGDIVPDTDSGEGGPSEPPAES
jgi:large subunit ribosomal protein L25